jgi:hypothetical protein
MRRRNFVGIVCTAAAWSLAVQAQETTRIPRIGVLWHAGSAEEEGRYFTGFTEGLRDLGYRDGQNVILVHRFSNEMPARFRSMAAVEQQTPTWQNTGNTQKFCASSEVIMGIPVAGNR